MPLTDIGTEVMAGRILGDGSFLPFDNTNAAIGVGDDNTAFATSQTQLQAEANATSALRKGMNSGYPIRDPDSDGSGSKTRYQVSFGSSEGNFTWVEWGVFNSTTSGGGQMPLRVVESLGTKSGGTWVFEVDVDISA